MRNHGVKRILSVLLVFALIASIGLQIGSNASALTTQEEIDLLREEAVSIENKKNEIESQINSFEYDQLSILEKKTVLDEHVIMMEAELYNVLCQIETYDRYIDDKEMEVFQAQRLEEVHLDSYKTRLRAMEENGVLGYLDVIFSATSFMEFMSRLNFIRHVMEYESGVYEKYLDSKLVTAAKQEELEAAKQEQEILKESLGERYQELGRIVAEADSYIINLESSENTYHQLKEEADTMYAQMEQVIANKTAELKQQVTIGTGVFYWPVPSETGVEKTYGTKLHPVYMEYSMHYGIDVAAAYGAQVVAADIGTVTVAAYNKYFGNYIVINHGNGYQTLYAHLGRFEVEEGQEVVQGQPIGTVGSTGVTNNAHLHFELRDEGERINPLDFYTGYVIME